MNNIDILLHANILSYILANLDDRVFINKVIKFLNEIENPTEDETNTIEFLSYITTNKVIDVQEAYSSLAGISYTPKLEQQITYSAPYTKNFKSVLLGKMAMKKTIATVLPYRNRITELLSIMDRNGTNKKGTDAVVELQETINSMSRDTKTLKVSSIENQELIIDPLDNNTDNYRVVTKQLQISNANKVKTIPVIDSMLGGGFQTSGLYLIGAIAGFFKSGLMQNLALYASINNNLNDFITDGYRPIIVYFSFELELKQCLSRHLAWFGASIPEFEKDIDSSLLESKLMEMVDIENKKNNVQVPIVYKRHRPSEGTPDGSYIEEYLETLEDNGYKCVLCIIDYMDRMELRNKRLNLLGESGGEGAAKIRLKARDLRDIGIERAIPMITATQLNGKANAAKDLYDPHLRIFDPLQAFGLQCVAGSQLLRSEVEEIFLCHKIDITEKNQETEDKQTRSFLALSQEKNRDNLSNYAFSKRDKTNRFAYNQYIEQLKNSSLRDLLKITPKTHVVIPMKNFRVIDDDYGMSIRMFYTSEASDFVSIDSLIGNSISTEPTETKKIMEELGFE